MANLYYTNQYVSTTLAEAGGIDDSQTSDITLQSVSGIETTKPGICCISYSDPIDTTKAEWITYTSIDASKKLVGATRGAEGFAAKSHAFGAAVAFPLSKSHINNLNDALSTGWTTITTALTRTADTTATLSGDWTDRIQKGDKLWWLSDGSSRYNYVIDVSYSSPSTTLTITSGYVTTANDSRFESGEAITEPMLSHIENPFGFPVMFNYTPTLTGSTTNPTIGNSEIVGKFRIQGAVCTVNVFYKFGSTFDSGSGSWGITYPIVPNSSINTVAYGHWISLFCFDANGLAFNGWASAGARIRTPSGNVNPTSPFTWTENDAMMGFGSYYY